jgi:aminoglycoside 3-N-acetyltransferase I
VTGRVAVVRLGAEDIALARELNATFATAFGEPETYQSSPPREAYLRRALGRDDVIALAAVIDGRVVGGLVAYVLAKLEQERSEIYIYDLAVEEEYRRRGIARALIEEVRRIAAENGAWVIYVQADHGDAPAVALYEGLGRREDVLHFDIEPAGTGIAARSV